MHFVHLIFYHLLRLIVKAGLYFYFRKIKVSGVGNIPKDQPIIFGANHENAFMDALLIATHTTKFCHYLVRADIFKYKIIRQLLRLVNMMPVYRIRDGFNKLKNNENIFSHCFTLLGKGHSLIMFPEGSHDIRRVERKLTKGISKIALGASNLMDDTKKLVVVPVGLNYSQHKSFRASVHIVFGEPIPVPSIPPSPENQTQLRNEIGHGLNDCHIRLPLENYSIHYVLWILMEKGIILESPQRVNQQIERAHHNLINSNSAELHKAADSVQNALRFFQSPSHTFQNGYTQSLLRTILITPLAIYGWMNNLVLLVLMRTVVFTLIKDHIFDTSIKFSLGFLFSFILYSLQTLLVYQYTGDIILCFLYAISLPAGLLIYNYWLELMRMVRASWRFQREKGVRAEFVKAQQILEQFKQSLS